MERFLIEGGNRLTGEVRVHKAKNSVLALLAASVMTEEKVVLKDCPKILDVLKMTNILSSLGVKVEWVDNDIHIDSSGLATYEIPETYAREIRSSIFLMGSILSRLKKAKAVFPGGCEIGLRPINLHLKGLRDLNVKVIEEGGYIFCDGENAKGNIIHLDFPSVGATENIMLAAVTAKGQTVINNAAKEPEIVALADFLRKMGAKVNGAGSSSIYIEGVKKLHGVEYTPIPDRIEAGTFLLAGAITGGDVVVKECFPWHMQALLSKLDGNAGKITIGNKEIRIKAFAKQRSIEMIETQPYPGFPTDLQAQILALQCIADNSSMIVENLFETRFKHVSELAKMGANIVVRDRYALVRGVDKLHGAIVHAPDLRAGAALVLAALAAEGQSEIRNIAQIDRGYYKLEDSLKCLGAKIQRLE
jgi:UDP-N-acetylglucosamine 1-carboxyvinyltransferase